VNPLEIRAGGTGLEPATGGFGVRSHSFITVRPCLSSRINWAFVFGRVHSRSRKFVWVGVVVGVVTSGLEVLSGLSVSVY